MNRNIEGDTRERMVTGENLAMQLAGKVTATLDTMSEKGIPDGATVGRLKGVFPQIRDRDIDRILGKSSKRMGTIVVPRDSVVKLVVSVGYPSQVGNKPFDKALESAIRDENRKRAEAQRLKRNGGSVQSRSSGGK
ncbi:MAG TPA: hypothetical protein VM077_03620 [Candidatus Limnocylindrales bacterium]|nr:hypothetical protein [Candidatus Limnocylindrales bacterium]